MLEIKYQCPDFSSVLLELTEVKVCSGLRMKYMDMERHILSAEDLKQHCRTREGTNPVPKITYNITWIFDYQCIFFKYQGKFCKPQEFDDKC